MSAAFEVTDKGRYRVGGMDCGSCARKIETAVRRIPGVENVAVSVAAGTMTVSGEQAASEDVTRQVTRMGFSITPLTVKGAEAASSLSPSHSGDHGHDHTNNHGDAHDGYERASIHLHARMHDHGASEESWWKGSRGLPTIACGLALIAAYAIGKLVPPADKWAFMAAMAVGLAPIARRAFVAARSERRSRSRC